MVRPTLFTTLTTARRQLVARRKLDFVRAVRGKVIDRIVIGSDDYLEIDIRFQDNTSLAIELNAQMRVESVDLLGWKQGNSRVLRKLV